MVEWVARKHGSAPLKWRKPDRSIAKRLFNRGSKGWFQCTFMEFSNNFYVAVKSTATGEGAFELLVDRYTGFSRPEPQTMMWNTKYGHMAWWGGPGYGMMGSGAGTGNMGRGQVDRE